MGENRVGVKRGVVVCGVMGSLLFNTGFQGVGYVQAEEVVQETPETQTLAGEQVAEEAQTEEATQPTQPVTETAPTEDVSEEGTKVEEVKAEEPSKEEVKLEEPTKEEVKSEEPSKEGVKTEEVKAEEPTKEGVSMQQEQDGLMVYMGLSELSANKPVGGEYKVGVTYDFYFNIETRDTGVDLSNIMVEFRYDGDAYNEGVLADNLYEEPRVKSVEFEDGVMRVYLHPVEEGSGVSIYLKLELQAERALNRVPYGIGVTITNNDEVYYQNDELKTLQVVYDSTVIDMTANNKYNGETLTNVSGHILYNLSLSSIPQASKEAVTYAYLPYYVNKAGESVQAVFDPELNDGWELSESGDYATYTQPVIDGYTVKPIYIDLSFPEVAGDKLFVLEVEMVFTPMDERASEVFAEGYIENAFAGRVSRTMPETGTTGSLASVTLATLFMGITGFLQIKKGKEE